MRLTPDQQTTLRRAREAAGLTQIDLAEAIGSKNNRLVSAAENGDYIHEDTLQALCRALGLTFTPSRPAEISETKNTKEKNMGTRHENSVKKYISGVVSIAQKNTTIDDMMLTQRCPKCGYYHYSREAATMPISCDHCGDIYPACSHIFSDRRGEYGEVICDSCGVQQTAASAHRHNVGIDRARG